MYPGETIEKWVARRMRVVREICRPSYEKLESWACEKKLEGGVPYPECILAAKRGVGFSMSSVASVQEFELALERMGEAAGERPSKTSGREYRAWVMEYVNAAVSVECTWAMSSLTDI
jgi:hypothetical protein